MRGLLYRWGILVFIACLCFTCKSGDDGRDEPRLPEDDPTEIPGGTASEVVKVVYQSIKQDSVVRAENTSSLVLTYSADISIDKPELITVNGRVIVSAVAHGKTLTLPLSLEPATDYLVQIKQDALVAVGNATVKAFSLNFSTRATVNLGNVNTSLCNEKADEVAKDLYKKFLSVYGKQTFSGVWEQFGSNDFVEQIFTIAQRFPAIVCCDFSAIHTSDYSDIDLLKSHYLSGGIVAFGWQWLTPAQENDLPVTYSADSGFCIKRALNYTTWEARFVESDIDRVAACLKQFRESGIPVVFSPMIAAQRHWWGQHEAVYFRELWKLLYDRLVVKHELNNLIWVWTTDTDNMTEEQILEWYPGDEYVDIVTIAPAGEDTRSLIDTFLLLNGAFEGTKMLAVADCVAVPNPEECYANGDTWLYFIAPSHFSVNTPAYWNTLLNHPSILPK